MIYIKRKSPSARSAISTALTVFISKSRIFTAAKKYPELAPEITIGSDPATAAALEKMGARHQEAKVDEIVVDSKNRIVTTPCYMLAQSIKDVGAGVEKLVAKIMEMAG